MIKEPRLPCSEDLPGRSHHFASAYAGVRGYEGSYGKTRETGVIRNNRHCGCGKTREVVPAKFHGPRGPDKKPSGVAECHVWYERTERGLLSRLGPAITMKKVKRRAVIVYLSSCLATIWRAVRPRHERPSHLGQSHRGTALWTTIPEGA